MQLKFSNTINLEGVEDFVMPFENDRQDKVNKIPIRFVVRVKEWRLFKHVHISAGIKDRTFKILKKV